MAIDKLKKPLQGKLRYSKLLDEKVDEVIDALNGLTDGAISTDDLTLTDDLIVGGDVTVTGTTALNGELLLAKSGVTQLVGITTGVAATGSAGVITTVSSTLAALSDAVFTFTNASILTSSTVIMTIEYVGAGIAHLNLEAKVAGSVDVRLYNLHATNAFNAVLNIHYLVL